MVRLRLGLLSTFCVLLRLPLLSLPGLHTSTAVDIGVRTCLVRFSKKPIEPCFLIYLVWFTLTAAPSDDFDK